MEQVLIATWLCIEVRQVGLRVLKLAPLAIEAMTFEEFVAEHSAVLACHVYLLLKLVLVVGERA